MKSARAKSADVLRLPLRRVWGESTRERLAGRRWEWVSAALVIAIALVPMAALVKVLALGLVLAALVLTQRTRRVVVEPDGFIAVDGAGIARERANGVASLASWGGRFGLALLANESREHGLFAFTTAEHTRFVAVRGAGEDDTRTARELFARAATIADADLAGESNAKGDALSAGDALRVLAAVRARDASALGRILLTDSRGTPIVLDGDELRAGDRIIDLTSPLEWRAFSFVESTGNTAALVQAAWVRQSGVDLVLVAGMPEGGVAREHSSSAAPPPVELRMAIERLFMAPLRDALGRAPRASRVPPLQTTRAQNVDRRA